MLLFAISQPVFANIPKNLKAVTTEAPGQFCKIFTQTGMLGHTGSQQKDGKTMCVSTPIGIIGTKMASTLIVSPTDGSTINSTQPFIVRLSVENMVPGFFSNADTEYYSTPQLLDGGLVQGHQHITIQKVSSASDPQVFSFFKGINDGAIDLDRPRLEAIVLADTLKEDGEYRICSLSGSFGHQPIVSFGLRRGPQDDCIRINVVSGSALASNVTTSNGIDIAALEKLNAGIPVGHPAKDLIRTYLSLEEQIRAIQKEIDDLTKAKTQQTPKLDPAEKAKQLDLATREEAACKVKLDEMKVKAAAARKTAEELIAKKDPQAAIAVQQASAVDQQKDILEAQCDAFKSKKEKLEKS
jgi:hypothetical protein